MGEITQVFSALRREGIEPILIKGWAVSRFYPSFSRQYSDIDICVSPDDYERALRLIRKEGFVVDLHRGLRHLDSVSWDNLFSNSILIETEKGQIRVLRDEDHLRLLCVHWLNDGGVNKERLKDIYYLIKAKELDWERVLNVVDGKRREWIEIAIGITDIYLGLQDVLKGTVVEKAVEKVPKWMLKFLEEKWKDNRRIIPLHLCVKSPRVFFEQLLMRFPPNPIQAVVEVEGDMTANRVVIMFYQLKSFFIRFYAFLGRLLARVN